MTISVTCKDEATKARYMTLAAKMEADSEFKAALNQCKTEQSIFDLYKKHGYTDLSFETFKVEFRDMINGIVNAQPAGTFELSEDDLENVVGGFDLFRFFTAAISAVPIAGPIIAGVAKAIKAGVTGQGAAEVVKQLGVGLGLAMVDAVVTIATMGAGNVVTTALKAGLIATGAIKAGLNEALDS